MTDASRHSAQSVRAERERARRRAAVRRAWRIVVLVVIAALTVGAAGLTVTSTVDAVQPRVWGTFTESGCEPRFPRGCRPVGEWVSDDGGLALAHAYLDGAPGADGTARATYTPQSVLTDDVVHAPGLIGLGPWVAAFSCLALGVGGVLLARRWGFGARSASRGGPPHP